MVRTQSTELSVHVGRRRWRCVLDPHLCLTRNGAAFVCELVRHAEVWISAGALNILDDWMLLEEVPAALMWTAGGIPDAEELRDASSAAAAEKERELSVRSEALHQILALLGEADGSCSPGIARRSLWRHPHLGS